MKIDELNAVKQEVLNFDDYAKSQHLVDKPENEAYWVSLDRRVSTLVSAISIQNKLQLLEFERKTMLFPRLRYCLGRLWRLVKSKESNVKWWGI